MSKENINIIKQILLLLLLGALFAIPGLTFAATVSNPIIWADVPDVSMLRVENNYYMVSTTMHYAPGVPVMKSTDLANWRTVNYAYQTLTNNDNMNLNAGKSAYGKGSWASSLRYYKGKYYILTPSYTTNKTHLYSTDDIEEGSWDEVQLPFYHDPSLFFDDDGKGYIVYGGGSFSIVELNSNYTGIVGSPRTIVSESARDQATGTNSYIVAMEGAHIEKVGDTYYIFAITWPNGNGRTELVFRSNSLMSGYTGRIMLQDNGVAQGSIFDTPDGKWYAMLFRDNGGVGRIPYLLPVTFKDGWPTVENNKVPATLELSNAVELGYNMVTSDDFDGTELALEFQWNHNPDNKNWALKDGKLRITTGRTDRIINDAKNTLTQRSYGPKCSGRTYVKGDGMNPGDFAGLVALADSLGFIALEKTNNGFNVVQYERDIRKASEAISGSEAYFRIDMDFSNNNWGFNDKAKFYYSLDGKSWKQMGRELSLPYTLGMFVGYRFGLFNFATQNAGGYAEFEWYKIGNDENDEIYLDPLTEPIPQQPFNGTPLKIPGKIEAEDFDLGSSGLAYYDNTSKNEGGKYREDTRVDIVTVAEDETDVSKGYAIGYTAENEWIEYTIYVEEASSFNGYIRAAAGLPNGKVHLELDEKQITPSIAIDSTGSWNIYQNFEFTTDEIPAGEHVLRLVFEAPYVNVDYIQLGDNTDNFKNYSRRNSLTVNSSNAQKIYDLKGNLLNQNALLKPGVYLVKTPQGNFLKRIEKSH